MKKSNTSGRNADYTVASGIEFEIQTEIGHRGWVYDNFKIVHLCLYISRITLVCYFWLKVPHK